jgi:hypothetical protein
MKANTKTDVEDCCREEYRDYSEHGQGWEDRGIRKLWKVLLKGLELLLTTKVPKTSKTNKYWL